MTTKQQEHTIDVITQALNLSDTVNEIKIKRSNCRSNQKVIDVTFIMSSFDLQGYPKFFNVSIAQNGVCGLLTSTLLYHGSPDDFLI